MRHAETLFAAERSAEEELRALRGLDSGLLRIGASTTIATYLIPDVLGAFHAAHPRIDLHLVSANTRDIADLMIAHDIDVALVEGPVETAELIGTPWRTDVMSLIAAPAAFAQGSGSAPAAAAAFFLRASASRISTWLSATISGFPASPWS